MAPPKNADIADLVSPKTRKTRLIKHTQHSKKANIRRIGGRGIDCFNFSALSLSIHNL